MNCAAHNDIAAVAFCRTCGKPLCANCTRDVRGVVYCEPCLAARLEGTAPAAGFLTPQPVYAPVGGQAAATRPPMPSSGPNPTVAGILAGFFPIGVGAVYTGQYAKGLAHLVIALLMIIGVSSDLPWYVITVIGISMGFFYVYQIIDSVRSAKAIQLGQPPPDPFGLGQTFGMGEKIDASKVPAGAVILIGLGVIFLLHTVGIFEFGLDRFWPLILVFLGVWLFAKHWGLLGTSRFRCACEHCRTRKLMGPAVLVTIGVLFLLETTGGMRFGRTWPAILLVIGVVKLVQSNASFQGHVELTPPVLGYPGMNPGTTQPPAQPQNPPAQTQPSSPDSSQPPSNEVKNV